ncbi:MAG: sodium/proton-translocating pyrophosphatase, partial [Actinobacteria bacterium]|nr:sodium/proton-translocating pyrophosphatase [Actinomycetota bacterium]
MASHHLLALDNPLAISSGQRGFVFVILVVAILALVYSYVLVREVLAADTGTPNMQAISKAVQEGASAYLNRQ